MNVHVSGGNFEAFRSKNYENMKRKNTPSIFPAYMFWSFSLISRAHRAVLT